MKYCSALYAVRSIEAAKTFYRYNANRPGEARQPGVLFSYSRLSYNGREIGLTRLLMDYPCPAAKQSAILPL